MSNNTGDWTPPPSYNEALKYVVSPLQLSAPSLQNSGARGTTLPGHDQHYTGAPPYSGATPPQSTQAHGYSIQYVGSHPVSQRNQRGLTLSVQLQGTTDDVANGEATNGSETTAAKMGTGWACFVVICIVILIITVIVCVYLSS